MKKSRINYFKLLILLQVYGIIIGGGFIVKPLYHWNRNILLQMKAKSIWIEWKLSNTASGNLKPEAWLAVPDAGIKTLVILGDSKENLLKYPCLVENGNLLQQNSGIKIISAHRDMHFRNLHKLKKGDKIYIELKEQKKTYEIFMIEIVSKEKAGDYLRARRVTDTLVLLTCYPFKYTGPAPERYIIWAESRNN
ncbi:MAG: class D sortase [bacterium]|nr:class D sortase [bacterium]